MDIKRASQELYTKLRKYDEVIGVAVANKNGLEYIVVYLENTSKIIQKKIPSIYKGNTVKTEVTGNVFLQ